MEVELSHVLQYFCGMLPIMSRYIENHETRARYPDRCDLYQHSCYSYSTTRADLGAEIGDDRSIPARNQTIFSVVVRNSCRMKYGRRNSSYHFSINAIAAAHIHFWQWEVSPLYHRLCSVFKFIPNALFSPPFILFYKLSAGILTGGEVWTGIAER